jgi:hypothetical protein
MALSLTFNPATENCFAYKVKEFKQAKTKQGTVIEAIRSNPQQALGAPQDNDTYNFVALGFGGSITLELAQPLYDNNGYKPDFIVVETSFGRADEKCFKGGNTFNYPENVVIEVSDGVRWRSLPDSYCRTSFIDISSVIDGTFPYVKLIRLRDFSNKDLFENLADGFDVDGLIVCPTEVERAFTTYTNGRTAEGAWDPSFFNYAPNEPTELVESFISYPNPAVDNHVSLEYTNPANDHAVEITVYNPQGLRVMSIPEIAKRGKNEYTLDVATYRAGVYVVRIRGQGRGLSTKIIKP